MTAFRSPRRQARADVAADARHAGRECLQEKKTLVETSTDVASFTCVTAHRSRPSRILTGFPFTALWQKPLARSWPPIVSPLSYRLGPSHPQRNTLPEETLPTFAQTSFKFVLATHAKICTIGGSSQAHAQ